MLAIQELRSCSTFIVVIRVMAFTVSVKCGSILTLQTHLLPPSPSTACCVLSSPRQLSSHLVSSGLHCHPPVHVSISRFAITTSAFASSNIHTVFI